jgi:hypothetical protein
MRAFLSPSAVVKREDGRNYSFNPHSAILKQFTRRGGQFR